MQGEYRGPFQSKGAWQCLGLQLYLRQCFGSVCVRVRVRVRVCVSIN